MPYSFSESDIQAISAILNAEAKVVERSWYFHISSSQPSQTLALTLHNNVQLGSGDTGSIITAQTVHGYFELHNVSGYVVVEPDEIIFVAVQGKYLSSMVVGAGCTCSLFANIDRSIIEGDFASLDTSVLMAAMQLSLTEQILV